MCPEIVPNEARAVIWSCVFINVFVTKQLTTRWMKRYTCQQLTDVEWAVSKQKITGQAVTLMCVLVIEKLHLSWNEVLRNSDYTR